MVYILNKYQIHKLELESFLYNVLIRITDPLGFFQRLDNKNQFRDILELEFYDYNKIERNNLKYFNIKHFTQIINFFEQHKNCDNMVIHCDAGVSRSSSIAIFWWYTRKKEIAIAANEFELPNLRAYLSLDPCTDYPGKNEYSYGITYLLGQGLRHKQHEDILEDNRLVAIFPLKKGSFIEDLDDDGLTFHPKICKEKQLKAEYGGKGKEICLSCSGRCNYSC